LSLPKNKFKEYIYMWFNNIDIKKLNQIKMNDLDGYVLPHAGTKFTGNILSHTLRFKPLKRFNKVYIFYLPSQKKENVINGNRKYYHEYYVPMKTLNYVIKNFWKKNTPTKFIGINVLKQKNIEELKKIKLKNSLIIISADFSHFLPMQEALELENKWAHSIMHKINNIPKTKNIETKNVVDDIRTFNLVSRLFKNINYQWVGRTRSPGKKGVGYLSFLLRKPFQISNVKNNKTRNNKTRNNKTRNNKTGNNKIKKPNGFFVTAYDITFTSRECLGEWSWNEKKEKNLIKKVIKKATEESRLTGGRNKEIPVKYYTITYLFLDRKNKFIRGFHGIKHNAFYLSDVFLENTYNNGNWINYQDMIWQKGNNFNLSETFNKLKLKAGIETEKKYDLYFSRVKHLKINY
jgi:hypothetical protein